MTVTDTLWTDEEWRAAMSSADINDLDDDQFAYIEPGGEKDDSGKTTPRSLRHFPINDAAHVRNALARLSSSPFGAKAKAKVLAAAKKFGVDVSEQESATDDTEHRHASTTTTHSHNHSANGSQGDDETHSHEHSHDGDASHDHTHDRSASANVHRALRGDLRGTIERRWRPFDECEVRMVPDGTGGSNFRFTGYASVFDSPYDITDALGKFSERVKPVAFDKTIAQRCDTVFLTNHGGLTMARTKSGTLKLSTDSKGLFVDAELDKTRVDVLALYSSVDRSDVDEMSFAFRCIRDAWTKDWTQRDLLECSLDHGDVCPVNFGANGATAGLVAMRARGAGVLIPSLPEVAGALKEWRAGASLSSANTAVIRHALSLFVTADTAVDEGQVILSDLLGVPNPDTDEDRAAGADEQRVDSTTGCNCCQDCGDACDGTCCESCQENTIDSGDLDATEDTPDGSMGYYAALDADRERRRCLLEED